MANVFVFAESRQGALRKVALEAMTAARAARRRAGGGEVHALLLGAPGIAAHAAALGDYGADVVTVVEHPALALNESRSGRPPRAAARIRAGGYRAAVFGSSAQGRDSAPRVAAKLAAPIALRCHRVRVGRRQDGSAASGLHGQSDRHAHAHRLARSRLAPAERVHTGEDTAVGADRVGRAGGRSWGLAGAW